MRSSELKRPFYKPSYPHLNVHYAYTLQFFQQSNRVCSQQDNMKTFVATMCCHTCLQSFQSRHLGFWRNMRVAVGFFSQLVWKLKYTWRVILSHQGDKGVNTKKYTIINNTWLNKHIIIIIFYLK